MPLVITPELGIPLPINTTPEEIEEFRERARALCETVKELVRNGADIAITPQDEEAAHELFMEQTPLVAGKVTPGAILKLEALLSTYDRELLNANTRLRAFVTNRLLEETETEKASDRLRALELLGKISDVGLFSEKLKVEVTHRTTADIESEILKRLTGYIDVTPTLSETEKDIKLIEQELDEINAANDEDDADSD